MTDFSAAMRKAAGLTRSYNLLEATRVIQDALTGRRARCARHAGDEASPLVVGEAGSDRGGRS